MTDIFTQISIRIIREQESIIGPLAWNEAMKVTGFSQVDKKSGVVEIEGDKKEAINKLIAQYERLFGQTSHEVCRDAVKDLLKDLQPDQIPSSLK